MTTSTPIMACYASGKASWARSGCCRSIQSVVTRMIDYLAARDRLIGHPAKPLFVTDKATRLTDCSCPLQLTRALPGGANSSASAILQAWPGTAHTRSSPHLRRAHDDRLVPDRQGPGARDDPADHLSGPQAIPPTLTGTWKRTPELLDLAMTRATAIAGRRPNERGRLAHADPALLHRPAVRPDGGEPTYGRGLSRHVPAATPDMRALDMANHRSSSRSRISMPILSQTS